MGKRGASQSGAPLPIRSLIWRLVALAVIDAFAITFARELYGGGIPIAAVALVVITAIINVVFLVERLYPLRWISPGVFLLVLFVVYPVLYTVYIAFTNYSGAHILSKEQVVTQLERQFYTPEGASSLEWRAYRSGSGEFLIWLTDSSDSRFLADPNSGIAPVDPADPRFGPVDTADGLPATIDGYTKLSRIESVRYLTLLSALVITGDINGQTAQLHILSLDRAEEGLQRYTYDAATSVVTDRETNVGYEPQDGFFVAGDGTHLQAPGFSDFVGVANFSRVLTDPRLSNAFFGVFTWTVAFAAGSVFFTFVVGLGLALVFNDKHLPGKGVFRTLAIIPYTVPGFISALIWVGLLNPSFGPINEFLRSTIGINPQWFSDGTLAKVAIFLINTWLGYPYMLIVTLGALQSIPSDLYEAAEIDGASVYQRFRRITFPLLLIAITPLLIGSFAFNFNNFTLIELVTQGGPAVPGSVTPAGQTDILISYSYRLAFAAGKGNDYAFAATISIFIFLIIAAITLVNFRLSRRVENLI